MPAEDSLLSVGIDIGTTTTHLVVTRLKYANLARPTHVNQLAITDREVLFESSIYETPLTNDGIIDADAVAELITDIYAKAAAQAGLDMSAVDTGAVIITGESARKRNAQAILENVAKFAGEFVIESAGPDLESILCARGSGAQARSREEGKRVLSLDIGGGTSNFALLEKGQVTVTGALSIGGRAIRFSNGQISHLSESAGLLSRKKNINLEVAVQAADYHAELTALADLMCNILMDLCVAEGKSQTRRPDCDDRLWLTPVFKLEHSPELIVISGGVAALMKNESALQSPAKQDRVDLNQASGAAHMYSCEQNAENKHEDFGIYLARALNQSLRKNKINYVVAANAIRATVLGAGMHTLQLTGSTIDFAADCLPLRNVPIIKIDLREQTNLTNGIKRALATMQIDCSKQPVALALTGLDRKELQYPKVKQLAENIARALVDEHVTGPAPMVLIVDQDIAMVMGQLLKRLVPDKRIISVDGIVIQDGDYLDIGKPVHSNSLSDKSTETLPVVVKTLIFYKN
jgi:ethanolamine utilization protein EutA